MDQRVVEICDAYTNGCLDRCEFLKKLALLMGGTAGAYALLPKLEKNDAMAQVISKDDPRLHTECFRYTGETGDIIAYAAQPKGRADSTRRLGLGLAFRS